MLQMPRMHGGQSSPEPSSPEPSSPEACSPEPSSPEATSPEPSSPEATSPEPASEHEQWSSRRRGACGAGRADRQRREKGAGSESGGSKGRGESGEARTATNANGFAVCPQSSFGALYCEQERAERRIAGTGATSTTREAARAMRRGDGDRPADLQVHVADDLVLLVVALDDGTESPRRGFLVALPRARREPVRVLGQVPGSRVGRWRGTLGGSPARWRGRRRGRG